MVATLVAVAVVALDQLVKWTVARQIGPVGESRDRWIAGDWLGLSYVTNEGVAFGLLADASALTLTAASIAALAATFAFVWTHRSSVAVGISGALIAGGALGNLIDRVRLGYVRDFIVVGPWPAFNLADSAITAGVVLAIFGALHMDVRSRAEVNRGGPAGETILDASK